MKPPIIVDENGDLYIYDSVADAAFSIEAVDVLNGEYKAFDSEGMALDIYAPSVEALVEIRMLPNAPNEHAKLRETMINFIRRVGFERFSIKEHQIQRASLSTLIDTIKHFQE